MEFPARKNPGLEVLCNDVDSKSNIVSVQSALVSGNLVDSQTAKRKSTNQGAGKKKKTSSNSKSSSKGKTQELPTPLTLEQQNRNDLSEELPPAPIQSLPTELSNPEVPRNCATKKQFQKAMREDIASNPDLPVASNQGEISRNTPESPRNTPESPRNTPESPRNTPESPRNTPSKPGDRKNTKKISEKSEISNQLHAKVSAIRKEHAEELRAIEERAIIRIINRGASTIAIPDIMYSDSGRLTKQGMVYEIHSLHRDRIVRESEELILSVIDDSSLFTLAMRNFLASSFDSICSRAMSKAQDKSSTCDSLRAYIKAEIASVRSVMINNIALLSI